MKFLICDDHEVFRSGLRAALAGFEAEILEASCCREAFEIIASAGGIDLALLDLGMPDEDGFACLESLRAEHPEVGVVIVSASEESADVRVALEGGALGFIPKSSNTQVIQSAIQIVLSGSIYVPPAILPALEESNAGGRSAERTGRRRARAGGLTERQLEVLNLICRGLTNKEIASVLGIGLGTVKVHCSAIFEALEVTNRTEAVLVSKELGIELPES
ncbi:MAG: response regulator transcription factor [Deltaproteobacteria bacterium]|nr:response regulator transcription factor [Deltaproteobacteria bacterium]MBW2387575.1 response regulator transcription factor [Deltaproteobacteria bacterium]